MPIGFSVEDSSNNPNKGTLRERLNSKGLFRTTEPKCKISGQKASDVPEYIVAAEDYEISAVQFVVWHEPTYDSKTNTFVSPIYQDLLRKLQK